MLLIMVLQAFQLVKTASFLEFHGELVFSFWVQISQTQLEHGVECFAADFECLYVFSFKVLDNQVHPTDFYEVHYII